MKDVQKFTYHIVNIKPFKGWHVDKNSTRFTYHIVNIKLYYILLKKPLI